MVNVYNDADYLAVYKQRQKILGVAWGVTAIYLAFCIGWLCYYISLPYEDPMQSLPKLCIWFASAIYIVFLFPFLAIKAKRCNKYFKMLTYLSEGLKNEERNYFYEFEKKALQKDNIDVWGCVFETWSKKKQEWLEREAYWDEEKPLPPLDSGDLVHYITQSNMILQYEIEEKKALEFEEIEEEE